MKILKEEKKSMDPVFSDTNMLKVTFNSCPIQASLGILGRKWALLILRNIGLFHKQRFNEMLKITPGLTKRVLSMRLKELESEQFIEVVEKNQNCTKWELTEKGRDALTILMVMVQFGSKYYATKVFKDQKPRNLDEVFEISYIQSIMSRLIPEYSSLENDVENTTVESIQDDPLLGLIQK